MYLLITLLNAENPNKYCDIVPFFVLFHTQSVMMSAIYMRYKGSELGEVLVAGGVIAEGSVDRALKGKHNKWGLRCLRLMYEALMRQLLKGWLTPAPADKTRKDLQILRNTSLSQEPRVGAHAALEEDADLESLSTYLHQGQLKRAGKMTARMRMRELMNTLSSSRRGYSFEYDDSESSEAECSDSD